MQVNKTTYPVPTLSKQLARDEPLPRQRPVDEQKQAARPPVERVLLGEVLSESQRTPAGIPAERLRIFDSQARLLPTDVSTRQAIQSYLETELEGRGDSSGLDILV